jgi:hypothetical protein
MSQPVKLSDGLVLEARLASEITERSIAGQIEFWAKLGRSVEPLLDGARSLALCRAGAAKSLSSCLELVGTSEGKGQLMSHLESQPFPHYEPAPGAPGFFVRIEADGQRTIGRFVRRRFEPKPTPPEK